MAGNSLNEWLVDPLLAPAEDVQDSADRLESNFRTWQQQAQEQKKTETEAEAQRLRLMSACDTLRWQLEVFERAVTSDKLSATNAALGVSAMKRRRDFVDIIRQQLYSIEVLVRTPGVAKPLPAKIPVSPPRYGDAGHTRQRATISSEVAAEAFSADPLLPGEQPRPSACPSNSLASGLSGFFGSASDSPRDSMSYPSNSSQTLLSGLLSDRSPEATVRPPATGMASPELVTEPLAASQMLQTASSEITCLISPDVGGPATPGPECKSFPSLAHFGNSSSPIHGWQCIFTWVHHLQRTTRRRLLEDSKDMRENLKGDDSAGKERIEGVLPLSRTSSTVNLSPLDSRSDWRVDVSSSSAPASDDEAIKKAGSAWHLSARPRRMGTLQRPVKPASHFILVCAAALLMVAATVYCSFTWSHGSEPRHASLLEFPALPASSPAFP